ncbi:NADH-ubiquinone dehydrogenase [Mesorhizobium sp. Root552]|uniref:NADH-ubiquinone dehydrogenase n=1 Tax=Mesorhizobium sp. Root552 TaxID=1736555 RepID=UPI0006F5EC79|nr:NADH-ubiquinone dehydrogenase [Mesorhizobium sp. Root552]KQZ19159.1 NADH-ubiquinone dehydrogenase [Mesorhizobium sp. Root552]
MSMFPIPDHLQADLNEFEKMNQDLTKMMPKEVASAINLFVHPAAGAAALSALGVGLASQAFGMWVGALTGAVEASQRLMQPLADESEAREALAPAQARSVPASRARATARTLIAEAQSLAKEVTEVDADAGKAAAQPTKAAVAVDASAAGEIMPEDFRKPAALEKPAIPDDLKAISGIGPKLEQVLNGLGIWTYGQVAGWSPEEIAWVDDMLGFRGRIGRDDWVGQATALSAGK